jgi:hypothetical protein
MDEQVKALAEAEGITFAEDRQATEAQRAEQQRQLQETTQARQAQTAQAIHAGQLDEVKIGPNGNVISGPIRRAAADAEEARLKAIQAEEREQRERERERAEKAAEAARKNGPGAGIHKIGRVDG